MWVVWVVVVTDTVRSRISKSQAGDKGFFFRGVESARSLSRERYTHNHCAITDTSALKDKQVQ
jgi:hypothetical protein